MPTRPNPNSREARRNRGATTQDHPPPHRYALSSKPQKDYDENEGKHIATLDWSQCEAVESIPGRVSGAWVLRGTQAPVKILFENLETGMSIEEVMEQFPVTREQLDSLMAFIARSLEKGPTYS
jgi:uncharacterized protein (DUF433 family)